MIIGHVAPSDKEVRVYKEIESQKGNMWDGWGKNWERIPWGEFWRVVGGQIILCQFEGKCPE